MKKPIEFSKYEVSISREKLENSCYTPCNVKLLEKIRIDEEEVEDFFDPVVELFYNLLDEDGRLQ